VDESVKPLLSKFESLKKFLIAAFVLNLGVGAGFMVYMYTETPLTFLGGNYVPSDTLKIQYISYTFICYICSIACTIYAMLDHDKGWLMAAVLFQVAFACSCHILYDDEDHVGFAIASTFTSFLVAFALMRLDQMYMELAQAGHDLRANKSSSFAICDLPDLSIENSKWLGIFFSFLSLASAFGWYFTVMLSGDLKRNDMAFDLHNLIISWVATVTFALAGLSGIYGAFSGKRFVLIIAVSLSLCNLSLTSISGANGAVFYQRNVDTCDYLNQDDGSADPVPDWSKFGWGHEELFAVWDELQVSTDQIVSAQASRTPPVTGDTLRQMDLYDKTGKECDKIVEQHMWMLIMSYVGMFLSMAQAWSVSRLSEKLQDKGVKIGGVFGVDFVKDLDSYMDPLQSLMWGVAASLACIYYIFNEMDVADRYGIPMCAEPPVPVYNGMVCPVIAATNQCSLIDENLCRRSCNGDCLAEDEFVTSTQIFGHHLFPAILLVVISALVYANSRDGTTYDKEFSNSIWFLSIYGIGMMIFFGTLDFAQSTTNDWGGGGLVSTLEPWYLKVLEVSWKNDIT